MLELCDDINLYFKKIRLESFFALVREKMADIRGTLMFRVNTFTSGVLLGDGELLAPGGTLVAELGSLGLSAAELGVLGAVLGQVGGLGAVRGRVGGLGAVRGQVGGPFSCPRPSWGPWSCPRPSWGP